MRFDTRVKRVAPVHLFGSCGLAPAFPPLMIDGLSLGDPGCALFRFSTGRARARMTRSLRDFAPFVDVRSP